MRLTTLRPILLVAPLLGGLAALSGCGQVAELKPKPGHALPVAPYGRADTPGAGELLAPTSQQRPGRNVELHIRSEPRADDPFDLPPKE
jgi:hypothetical protein